MKYRTPLDLVFEYRDKGIKRGTALFDIQKSFKQADGSKSKLFFEQAIELLFPLLPEKEEKK